MALLKRDLADDRFAIQGVCDAPSGRRWGQIHFAFEIPPDRIDEAVLHIRNAGVAMVAMEGPMRQYWMNANAYYFYDLDGNLLEYWSPDP